MKLRVVSGFFPVLSTYSQYSGKRIVVVRIAISIRPYSTRILSLLYDKDFIHLEYTEFMSERTAQERFFYPEPSVGCSKVIIDKIMNDYNKLTYGTPLIVL